MRDLKSLTAQLLALKNLSPDEAIKGAELLSSPTPSADDKRDFLLALANKGETPFEVAAFARYFRQQARDPGMGETATRSIDIVGTGGSGSGGYNISSAAALITAAAGVPVLKHGNRAVTSQSGAADFLGCFGIPQQIEDEELRRSVAELNFCFFFAPAFHPSFKEIMPVRKTIAAEGFRTVFNILGPLINPARPSYQLLGVPSESWARALAVALHELGLKRGLVVYSQLPVGGMDEITCAGQNRVCGFGEFKEIDEVWVAEDFGLAPCPPSEVLGRTPAENVQMLRDMMQGGGPQGLRDSICWNAGAALWIAGAAENCQAGIEKARETLTDGALAKWLEKLEAFYKKN